MGTMTRSPFANILTPDLRDVIQLAYKEIPLIWPELVNKRSSDRYQEFDQTVEGTGAAGTKSEGANISYSEIQLGYKKTYTHTTYGMGLRVTREAFDDDRFHGVFKRSGAYLGRAMRAREEIEVANIYNRAFNSSYLGADSKELCSKVHPWASGSTGRNELSTAADLSATSLKQCLTDIRTTTEANAMKIRLMPKILLVHPDNEWAAKQLLKSVNEPGHDRNDYNVLNVRETGLKLVINEYLTDSDAFFILCDQHDVMFNDRMGAKLEADDDFDSGDAKFKITRRFSTGWSNWLGVFGSPGA